MSIREETVYVKVARRYVAWNILIKSPEMLSYVARNCVILNNIVPSLLPFTTLVSSHRRIIYNYITHYIPLVSSHHCLKNEACYTFIPLVSSHDGLKNETYLKTDTLYLIQINYWLSGETTAIHLWSWQRCNCTMNGHFPFMLHRGLRDSRCQADEKYLIAVSSCSEAATNKLVVFTEQYVFFVIFYWFWN